VSSYVHLHKMPGILGRQSPNVYRAYLYRLSGPSLGVLYVRIYRKISLEFPRIFQKSGYSYLSNKILKCACYGFAHLPPAVLALRPWHRLGAPTDSLFVS
jgi:hypothetical protein